MSQLSRNSVGTLQLKNGAVTNPKLRNSSVTSVKVANRSLLRADFAPGQVPAGATGPAGPAGPAGPPGVSGLERVELTTVSNTVTNPKIAQIACPAGKRLIGGGGRINGGGAAVALQQSFPDNDNVFRAQGREVVATGASWSVTAYAICAVAS